MSNEQLKLPPKRDFGFYQRRRHGSWCEVKPPSPALEGLMADSHAHLHMLPDPKWELRRCAANGVDAVCTVLDPSEDEVDPMLELAVEVERSDEGSLAEVVLALGVHPHNARLYSDQLEELIADYANYPLVRVLGEVGLDFHYDLSTREQQRDAFRRQVRLAQRLGLPLALHLRSGEDPVADDAHGQALAILHEEGFPQAGTLLHCCSLGPKALEPWLEEDCYIAYGGALTFKKADEAREGARLVPVERLLLETDAPYMTPEPMRGTTCTPAHVIFTAEMLAKVRGVEPGPDRHEFLSQLHQNTWRFLAGESLSGVGKIQENPCL